MMDAPSASPRPDRGASGAGASAAGSPGDLLKGMAAGCGLLLVVLASQADAHTNRSDFDGSLGY